MFFWKEEKNEVFQEIDNNSTRAGKQNCIGTDVSKI